LDDWQNGTEGEIRQKKKGETMTIKRKGTSVIAPREPQQCQEGGALLNLQMKTFTEWGPGGNKKKKNARRRWERSIAK